MTDELYYKIYDVRSYVATLLKRTCETKKSLFSSEIDGIYRANFTNYNGDIHKICKYYNYEPFYYTNYKEGQIAKIDGNKLISLNDLENNTRLYTHLYMLYFAINTDIREFPNIKKDINFNESHSDEVILANCFAAAIFIQRETYNILHFMASENSKRFKTYKDIAKFMSIDINVMHWVYYLYYTVYNHKPKKNTIFSKLFNRFYDKKLQRGIHNG